MAKAFMSLVMIAAVIAALSQGGTLAGKMYWTDFGREQDRASQPAVRPSSGDCPSEGLANTRESGLRNTLTRFSDIGGPLPSRRHPRQDSPRLQKDLEVRAQSNNSDSQTPPEPESNPDSGLQPRPTSRCLQRAAPSH